jgi:hypothetical protein
MSEEFSFFDDARLPSEEPDQGGLSAQGNYPMSNQYSTFPPISRSTSPLFGNDIPHPSIEVDFMESHNHDSMFVTPEPEERRRRFSTPLSIHSTPEVIHRPQFHKVKTLDDDCMIVEEADCSSESRQIWSISKSIPKTSGGKKFGDKAIKVEPGLEVAKPANLIEIQKRLISQHNAARLRTSGASTIFGTRTAHQINSSPSKRKPKPRRGTVYQPKSLDNIVDVKVEFETAMRQGGEELNWMGQHDEDEENEEFENLKRLRHSFQERQKAGSLTDVEAVEMMKINQQIALNQRRQEAINRLNQKEAISVSSDDEEHEGDHGGFRQSDYNQEDKDDHMTRTTESVFFQGAEETVKKSKSNANKKPTKSRRKVAKTAREVEENRREKEREKERKKRARAALSKRAPLKGKKSKKAGKVTGPKAKKQHKSHMKSALNDRETLQTLLQDLVHSDFIADRQAQGELPDAPEIHETNKNKALHVLLASVPDDYDTHRAKTERSDLDKASKHFGYGRVKFANGSWKVKGMKSHL